MPDTFQFLQQAFSLPPYRLLISKWQLRDWTERFDFLNSSRMARTIGMHAGLASATLVSLPIIHGGMTASALLAHLCAEHRFEPLP